LHISNKPTEYQFWASAFNVSSLINFISKKRMRPNRSLEKGVVLLEELSISKSKKENLDIFKTMIHSKILSSLAQVLFEDLYKYNFDNSSSVNPRMEIKKNATKKDSDKHQDVSLFVHTLGTTNEMQKLIGNKFGLYSDLFLILALVHDSGKSNKLKNDMQIDLSVVHNEASRVYLERKVLEDKSISVYYRNIFERVYSVLDAHHSKEKENLFYGTATDEDDNVLEIELIRFLKMADSNQRDAEGEYLSDV